MRILVCGGRTYGWVKGTIKRRNQEEYETFCGTLDYYLRDNELHLISGGATGADQLAEEWAKERQVPITIYHAQWDTYDRSAGPIRNETMLRVGKPDLVIAFPGNKGTAHMVKIAKRANIEVKEIP